MTRFPTRAAFCGRLLLPFGLVLSGLATACAADAGGAGAWPAVTAQNRPWTRWWWMGDAVDQDNLRRELTRYQEAGLGGVEITPIYGVTGNEANDIPFLSDKWMSMLNFSISTANHLGMLADMTTGTGWNLGGPTVAPEEGNARLVQRVQTLSGGENPTGMYDPAHTQALVAYSADGRVADVLSHLQPDGRLDWSPASGRWQLYAISQKPTGLMVKRAAPGGEGLMLNPIHPAAVSRYMQWFDASFAANPPRLNCLFQDSYEYNTQWAPDFLARFAKLRGYPLQQHLPAFVGSADADATARLKSDYRQTISDILIDASMPIWVKWAHDHHYAVRYQAHGAPANLLDLYAIADIPETEFFSRDRDILISKFASSAAHTQGGNLVGAETGTWLAEHFTETLKGLKYLVDDMFLAGVNHVVYQGTTYSPDGAAWPGWCFYASTEMNPRNPVWHDVPTLNRYIARCQSMLQAGRSDADVLLYWPIYDRWNDANGLVQNFAIDGKAWFHGQPIETSAKNLWQAGYAFDYISDRQILGLKAHAGGVVGNGATYRAIVVPPCRLMPVETLRQLLTLAANGAPVIFEGNEPVDVPGWKDLDARRAALQDLRNKIPAATVTGAQPLSAGQNRALAGDAVTALQAAGVGPEELSRFPGIEFVRRSLPASTVYFIANRGDTMLDASVKLNATAGAVEFMDPMNGRAGLVPGTAAMGGVRVRLALAAGQSLLVQIFPHAGLTMDAWKYPPTLGAGIPLSGTWNLKFVEGGPTLPAPITTQTLDSWTRLGDVSTQSFSGTADYSITFDAPSVQASAWTLDLGKVCESARVRLNRKDLGTLIAPPYVLRGLMLQPHGNVLEVEVTNTGANRIRDLDLRHVKWKIFEKPNVLNLKYKPFDASKWPITDSGLLGPVVLQPES